MIIILEIKKELCFRELEEFISYQETVKKSSEQTLYNYYRDLMLFFRYMKFIKGKSGLGQKIEEIYIADINMNFIESITIDDIYRYFYYLTEVRNNSERTRARRVVSIRMFFRYLHLTTEVLEKDPSEKLEFPSIKSEPPKYMNEADCITLLNSIDDPNKERDYCILVIFINCGIRLNELVRLNDTDIQQDGTVVIKGRGTEQRTIYFNQACMEALEEYNDFKEVFFEGKSYDHHAIFIGRSGKRLTGRWVEEIVKQRMKKAGFGDLGLSPNKLRHTAAKFMYRRGVDVSVLKEILGHKGMNTTQIYTNTVSAQLESAMKQNSLSRKKKQ
ncbi:MAG: tyrosine-type recombinase/integrase [Ruminococcus sp.]|nr:tyrosine-type recombinase/integrase [Ruminococcus sp.]